MKVSHHFTVDRSKRAKTLIVPGLRNSGPTHWQSWFQDNLDATHRVEQDDWEKTCLSDWSARVLEQIDLHQQPVWIVAHSYGCLASVTASFVRPEAILGAILVAPADPNRFNEPAVLLEEKLSFPSLVISSSNDPWVKSSVAERWAHQWGSDFINIGPAGHINVDSGHGPWQEGLSLFNKFKERAERKFQHAA